MCNDYERHLEWGEYVKALAAAGLEQIGDNLRAEFPPADNVRVGDNAPVLVQHGNGASLAQMRWGFTSARKSSAPVFNFKGEGRRFANSKRCVIPASAFFEFTGTRSPKTKWRFALPDQPIMGIAGLWHEEPAGPRFTTLTLHPGGDVAPFHDRQIVALAPTDWAAWLYLTRREAELLRPLPEGTLEIALVRKGIEEPATELCAIAAGSRATHQAAR